MNALVKLVLKMCFVLFVLLWDFVFFCLKIWLCERTLRLLICKGLQSFHRLCIWSCDMLSAVWRNNRKAIMCYLVTLLWVQSKFFFSFCNPPFKMKKYCVVSSVLEKRPVHCFLWITKILSCFQSIKILVSGVLHPCSSMQQIKLIYKRSYF